MTTDHHSLGRSMAKGAVWMVGLRWSMRLLGLVDLVVLARLLEPRDFGLVALGTMMVGIAEAMSRYGPETALIQNLRAERRHYDTVWTMNVIRNVGLAVLLGGAAAPAAGFFDTPELEWVVYCLAVAVAAEGLQNVGTVDFLKKLTFQREFYFRFASRIVSFVVLITAAVVLQNYWALVLGFVAYRLASVGLSYRMHPYRPRFSLAAWHEIFHFSKWILANNILRYLTRRADVFFIGRMLGPEPLGFYNIAKRFSELAGVELAGPIRNAVFPGYAQMSEHPDRLRQSFIGTFQIVVTLGAPVALALGLAAEPFVRVALGEKWLEVIPLMQVSMVFAFLVLANANTGAALLALGKPRILTVILGVHAATLMPLLYWTITAWGALGAVWSMAAIEALGLVLGLHVVGRFLNIRTLEFMSTAWRTAGAAALVAVAVLALRAVWPDAASFVWSLAELVTCLAVTALVYGGAHLLLWRIAGRPAGAEQTLLAIAHSRLPAGLLTRLAWSRRPRPRPTSPS